MLLLPAIRRHNDRVSVEHFMSDHFLDAAALPTRWQRFSLRVLALFGWRVNVAPLPGPRGVVVVYPHTSNWDFVIGLFAKWALGIRFRWLGKESLFSGGVGSLLGPFFRACGGEPIERSVSTGAIERLATRVKTADHYWLALAPEGTRKYREHWRSGFYHIALAADVPVGIACIDYGRRQVRMVDYLTLSGNTMDDLAAIRAAYRDCRGRRHELASPIVFSDKTMQQDQAAPARRA
jgi:1-acyl-sn-glycerol-3-phosphate acyltransferase